MSSLVIFFTVITVLIATAYLYVKNAFLYWKRRKIPYLEPSFPFGNFKKLYMQQSSMGDLFKEFYDSTSEPVIGTFSTTRPALVVRDPKIVQDILIRNFSSFYHRGMSGNEEFDPMANNMLLQNGEKWKRSRSKLSPAFTTNKIKGMFEVIMNCGNSLEKYVDRYAKSNETLEIRDLFARFATNVIASVSFGIEVDSIENPNAEFRQYGKRIFDPTFTHTLRGVI